MPNADYQSIFRGTEMDDRWGKAGTAVQGVKVNGTEASKDANNKVNLTLNKSTVGLGNVDNTSDANKPVSTAQAAAIAAEATARQAADTGLESRKANKDGYYEQMGVGYAKSLLGNGAATNEVIDFRPSGGTKDIGTGVETLKAIKGNTVVWNQGEVKQTAENSSEKWASDKRFWGVHIVSGSLSFNEDSSIISYSFDGNDGFFRGHKEKGYIVGHKYVILVNAKANTSHLRLTNGNENVDYSGSGNWELMSLFFTAIEYRYQNIGLRLSNETSFPQAISQSQWKTIDLTQMFGAGNEPTTLDDPRIKWLESFGYIPYNEGTLLNFKGEGLKTTGVNQWDEEWELGQYNTTTGAKTAATDSIRSKNFIEVFPNRTYYILPDTAHREIFYTKVLFYDAEKNFLQASGWMKEGGVDTPANARYMTFYIVGSTTYNHDIQIAIYHSGGDIPTTYHPYEEHTLALPITSLKANGVTIFPDGMKSAGTVKDELYGNSLGVITKAKKRIGVVKLKDLDWANPSGFQWLGSTPSNAKSYDSYTQPNYMANANYVVKSYNKYNAIADNVLSAFGDRPVIKDSRYDSAESFKAHFTDNDYLYYELAEPIEYTLDTPINTTTYVNDWGTEEVLPQGVDAQGLPKTTPLNAEIVYTPNVQDAIRNLPKNYIGKESMDAILEAFKTAGIIASFTLTFDATSGKYNCSITKPTE